MENKYLVLTYLPYENVITDFCETLEEAEEIIKDEKVYYQELIIFKEYKSFKK